MSSSNIVYLGIHENTTDELGEQSFSIQLNNEIVNTIDIDDGYLLSDFLKVLNQGIKYHNINHVEYENSLLTTVNNLKQSITINTTNATQAVYNNVETTTNNNGSGSTLNISVNSYGYVGDITVRNTGNGYKIGDTLTVKAGDLGTSSSVLIITLKLKNFRNYEFQPIQFIPFEFTLKGSGDTRDYSDITDLKKYENFLVEQDFTKNVIRNPNINFLGGNSLIKLDLEEGFSSGTFFSTNNTGSGSGFEVNLIISNNRITNVDSITNGNNYQVDDILTLKNSNDDILKDANNNNVTLYVYEVNTGEITSPTLSSLQKTNTTENNFKNIDINTNLYSNTTTEFWFSGGSSSEHKAKIKLKIEGSKIKHVVSFTPGEGYMPYEILTLDTIKKSDGSDIILTVSEVTQGIKHMNLLDLDNLQTGRHNLYNLKLYKGEVKSNNARLNNSLIMKYNEEKTFDKTLTQIFKNKYYMDFPLNTTTPELPNSLLEDLLICNCMVIGFAIKGFLDKTENALSNSIDLDTTSANINHTFNNVPTVTQSGNGRGATLDITTNSSGDIDTGSGTITVINQGIGYKIDDKFLVLKEDINSDYDLLFKLEDEALLEIEIKTIEFTLENNSNLRMIVKLNTSENNITVNSGAVIDNTQNDVIYVDSKNKNKITITFSSVLSNYDNDELIEDNHKIFGRLYIGLKNTTSNTNDNSKELFDLKVKITSTNNDNLDTDIIDFNYGILYP